MNSARDLLFGLLALEARLIVFDQLVKACTLCTTQQDIALSDMLIGRGWIQPSDRARLDDLVEGELYGLLDVDMLSSNATGR